MYETEEQRAAREAAQRRYEIRQLAAAALTGLIQHYRPETFEPPAEGETAGHVLQQVPQLAPEQITEIGLAAYELAEATLQAIEMGEKALAEEAKKQEAAS